MSSIYHSDFCVIFLTLLSILLLLNSEHLPSWHINLSIICFVFNNFMFLFYYYFFNSNLFYLFIFIFICGCVGSSFLCEGFL